MPLTRSGLKVMQSMMREYGKKKGRSVFYASMMKQNPGSNRWHSKKKK